MGIFDDVKKAAATVAGEVKEAGKAVGAEAGKAGRVAQAQVKLRSLQGEQGDAEKELGQAAYDLAESGQLATPALEEAVAKVREARAAVAVKEAEIEAIKAEERSGGTSASSDSEAGHQSPPPVAPQSDADPAQGSESQGDSQSQMPGT